MIATVEIFDRMEAIVDLGVPNYRARGIRGAGESPGRRMPDVPRRQCRSRRSEVSPARGDGFVIAPTQSVSA